MRLMSEAASKSPVYDLGTSGRFVKEVGLVRHLFDEQEYRAGGFHPDNLGKPGGCDFDCDIENMHDVPDGSVGSVICMEVLEHTQHPRQAVSEIHRVLEAHGIAIVSVPFYISYHGKSEVRDNPLVFNERIRPSGSRHSDYGDFWRFTHEGIALLFAEAGFSRVDVHPVDGWLLSRLQVLGLYHGLSKLPGMAALLSKLDRPRLGRATTMHFVRAEKS
jgi:SAM-dependent methyltransferase